MRHYALKSSSADEPQSCRPDLILMEEEDNKTCCVNTVGRQGESAQTGGPAWAQLLFHNLLFTRDFLTFSLTLSACSSFSNTTLPLL